MQCVKNLVKRAKDTWKRLEDEFWPLLLTLLAASGITMIGLSPNSLLEWLKALALAVLMAFLVWAPGYVSMLSSERRKREEAEKERDEARKALAEEREKADAERREFFQQMDERSQRTEKLLEQLVANTTPRQPNQPDLTEHST